MSVAAPPPAALAYAPPLAVSLERLRGALLWLTGLAGAFVFMEPSPYEIASLLTMPVFVFTGLTLTSAITPLIVMLMLYNIGYSVAVVPVIAPVAVLSVRPVGRVPESMAQVYTPLPPLAASVCEV